MSISSIVISTAQKAWKKTEEELKFKGYFATPLSSHGYKLSKNDINELNIFLLKIAGIFMALGSGGYFLSKSYPLLMQVILLMAFIFSPVAYFVKRHKVIKNKCSQKLPANKFKVYIKHFALLVEVKLIFKWLSLNCLCVVIMLGLTFSLIDQAETIIAATIMGTLSCFILIVILLQVYMLYLKRKYLNIYAFREFNLFNFYTYTRWKESI